MSQNTKNTLAQIALNADVDVKTARKYLDLKQLPEEIKPEHKWKTRKNPFEKAWNEIRQMLEINSGLEAKTIFDALKTKDAGKYSEGQLRTLQRRIKIWRATEGPAKEVFFPQEHKPGDLCESDFTRMKELNITINGMPFEHLVYHFVLTYSNWEAGEICYSESFESLSEGLQNALWELGGVPKKHRTDRLTTAVHNIGDEKGTFQKRYIELLNHYRITGEKTQAESPNENGDIEQRHYRFKRAVGQQLMLRGSRDFKNIDEYRVFLGKLFQQLNESRRNKLREEMKNLSVLPQGRQESCKKINLKVGPGSTIHVLHNTYSVHSRLIGENIGVKAHIDHLEIWYAQKCVDTIPRLKGEGNHRIDYRHIIDWLIRKPGAFENYRFREDMFPTTRFRIAYDQLKRNYPGTGHKKYLEILYFAAKEGEEIVDNALKSLIEAEKEPNLEQIKELAAKGVDLGRKDDVKVEILDIAVYDTFLENKMEVYHA